MAEARARADPRAAHPQARADMDTFVRKCGVCHTVAGTRAGGILGPDLSHLMTRRTIAAATLPNTIANLSGWIADPQHVKPGAYMPRLDISGPDWRRSGDFLKHCSERRRDDDALRSCSRNRRQDEAGPLARRLQAIWETKPGIFGWLSTVDHKEIGIRYIVTAFVFLMVAASRR